jgi:hypothetical protein
MHRLAHHTDGLSTVNRAAKGGAVADLECGHHITNGQAEQGMGPLKSASVVLAVVFCVVTFVLPVYGQSSSQVSDESQAARTPAGAGLQAASLLATIPYGAAKLGLALAGGIAGGVGYALSGGDLESAKGIWAQCMEGTYVLTPAHLKGEEPIHFIAPQPEADRERN